MIAHADAREAGITVTLMGGLGNQLFQYAAARSVAHRLQCPVFTDTSRLGASLPSDTAREFALDWLVDPAQVVSKRRKAKGSWVAHRVFVNFSSRTPGNTFRESGFRYDDRVTGVRLGATLTGYFQSWKYFNDIASSLRSELILKSPRSSWFDVMENDIKRSGPSIAVHVRRGDYLRTRNAAYHGVLGRDYYARALESLRANGVSGRLVIFSDEPNSAAELISGLGDIHLVHPTENVHPMESIALMSRCSAVVTANSSFSWWGAWLADPALTTVVSPAPWMRSSLLDDRDLRPTSWLSVPSDFYNF